MGFLRHCGHKKGTNRRRWRTQNIRQFGKVREKICVTVLCPQNENGLDNILSLYVAFRADRPMTADIQCE